MPTPKKEQELALLEDKFQRSKALVFTDFRGLSAQEMVGLRRLFRKSDLEYRVVKNTLARLAAKRTGLEVEQFLVGPTGVLIGYSDAVLPFKLATEVAKRYKQYEIKGGLLEGQVVQAAEAVRIAALPSREVLLTRLAFVLQAPMQKLASDLSSIIRRLAIVLGEVRKKKEQAEPQAPVQASLTSQAEPPEKPEPTAESAKGSAEGTENREIAENKEEG
jgi:large subunit ribosomal protein L10